MLKYEVFSGGARDSEAEDFVGDFDTPGAGTFTAEGDRGLDHEDGVSTEGLPDHATAGDGKVEVLLLGFPIDVDGRIVGEEIPWIGEPDISGAAVT